MGRQRFRFTLTVRDTSPVVSQVISEPEGWRGIKLTMERDKEFMGLIELFEVPLRYYRSNGVKDGGYDFIQNAISVYGLNVELEEKIERFDDDTNEWEDLFIGLLDIESKKTIDSRKIEMALLPDDFWAKFKNRYNTPVDLKSTVSEDGETIPATPAITQILSPQKVYQRTRGTRQTYALYGDTSNIEGYPFINQYLQIDWDDITLDEITTKYTYPARVNPDSPFETFSMEYTGEYTFDIKLYFTYAGFVFSGPPTTIEFVKYADMSTPAPQLDVLFLVNGEPIADVFSQTDHTIDVDNAYSEYNFNATINLNKGDTVTIVGKVLIGNGMYPILLGPDTSGLVAELDDIDTEGTVIPDFPSGYVGDNTFQVTANTIYQETEAESFLLHDVAYGVIDRVAKRDSFYSELLGSSQTLTRQYDEDGCEWAYSLTRGLQLRQYTLTEKPFSISFKQWWDGINPILNLGLMPDKLDGVDIIRVEDKAYFFNEEPILYLDFVNNIEESYDKDHIIKKIKQGYNKRENGDASGLDDAQGLQIRSLLFKTIGIEFPNESDFVGGSLIVEQARRTTKEKSADYKYDNDTFIIALNPIGSGSPVTFSPELDENFDSITGLLNYETRYNTRISTLRNIIRWSNYYFGCVQEYITSFLKFSSGEGNFDMVSDMTQTGCRGDFDGESLSEKQDLPVTYDHLFKPILKQFKHPLSYANYKLIRDNKTRAIAVSETDDNHAICFIKRIDYEPTKSIAEFKLWQK